MQDRVLLAYGLCGTRCRVERLGERSASSTVISELKPRAPRQHAEARGMHAKLEPLRSKRAVARTLARAESQLTTMVLGTNILVNIARCRRWRRRDRHGVLVALLAHPRLLCIRLPLPEQLLGIHPQ